jgi:hypothetical protein
VKRAALAAAALSLLTLLAALPAFAVAPMSPAAPAACVSSAAGPAFLWQTGGGCNESFCQTDEQCQQACPDASSATCSGGVCQYSFPGGGGGGGNPHGCYQAFCITSANCPCQDGTFAACINNLCTF